MLPRKGTALARAKGSLESVAFQIGTIVAVERNRKRLTQWDLAAEIGIDQIDISRIENGQPAGISDAKIDKLFTRLALPKDGVHCHFIKWWQKNSTL